MCGGIIIKFGWFGILFFFVILEIFNIFFVIGEVVSIRLFEFLELFMIISIVFNGLSLCFMYFMLV